MVLICFTEICFQLLLIKTGKKYHLGIFKKKKVINLSNFIDCLILFGSLGARCRAI